MKRIFGMILIMALLIWPLSADAKEPELKLMHVTAYTGGTVTASGMKPREGLCATDNEHFSDGWCAVIYRAIPNDKGGYDVGEMLWILECEDKGPKDSGVSKGKVIDVYRDNLERCQDVMDTVYENGAKGRVYVQFIQAEG